jgi:hypothetical protein
MLGTSKLDALILNAGALNLEKASTKQGPGRAMTYSEPLSMHFLLMI